MDNKELSVGVYIRLLSLQLKSPIAAIEALLQTISEGFAGEADKKTLFLVEKAIKRSSEAREIITDLMDYELYSENESNDRPEQNIADLCREVVELYSAAAAEKSIALR